MEQAGRVNIITKGFLQDYATRDAGLYYEPIRNTTDINHAEKGSGVLAFAKSFAAAVVGCARNASLKQAFDECDMNLVR